MLEPEPREALHAERVEIAWASTRPHLDQTVVSVAVTGGTRGPHLPANHR